MLTDIMDYRPKEVEFVLTDAVMEKFPTTLFDNEKDYKSVEQQINEHFVALFPESELAQRKLDEYEISNIREEYCKIQEDLLPNALLAQQEAYEEAKRMKKEADEKVMTIQNRISELAAMVKKGTEEIRLPSTQTATFALNGYNLTYTWCDGKFQLAKAEQIPEWGRNELWSQEHTNREAMKELFDLDFPEVKKPSGDEEENNDF